MSIVPASQEVGIFFACGCKCGVIKGVKGVKGIKGIRGY